MKIGYLADHFYPHVKRGAELETRLIIAEGRRRGHDIVECEGTYVKDVDFYVVGNYVDNFNVGELIAFLSRKRYVHMEHDLRAPHQPTYKAVAGNAVINVFRSPLHAKIISEVSGEYNHFLHPNSMPAEFADMGLERRPPSQVLYVGDYCWEKGYKEMAQWLDDNPEFELHHYGGGFPKTHPRMVEHGQVPYEGMPRVYNEFQTLVFLPAYPQACCRIIAEAFLCKVMNVITNGKDGFTSYGWNLLNDYDEVRRRLIGGPKLWWDNVEAEMEA